MWRLAVVGYGNPLRRDDGAGIQVAESVARRWGERITVLVGQQPVPEWAAVLSEVDVAFIVDAARDGTGRPRLRRLGPAGADPALGGHGFGAPHLLGLTQALYGRAPSTYLLSIPTADLGFGEGLSSATAQAVERAVRLLDRRLATLA